MKKKLIKTAQTKKKKTKQSFQIIQKAPLAWLLIHLNKTPYLKDDNATTLWQNIIKLRHTHKHHDVKNGILSLAIKKKTRELNVVIINSSSWPNMSTGDPVISSEWVFADEGLNTWPNRKTNAFYLY